MIIILQSSDEFVQPALNFFAKRKPKVIKYQLTHEQREELMVQMRAGYIPEIIVRIKIKGKIPRKAFLLEDIAHETYVIWNRDRRDNIRTVLKQAIRL